MNGVEFCTFLKNNPVTDDVNIIVVSAYLSSEVKNDVEELGVDCILDKPVRLANFVAAVGKLSGLELS
jgi:CheY-like chemotaxis protein